MSPIGWVSGPFRLSAREGCARFCMSSDGISTSNLYSEIRGDGEDVTVLQYSTEYARPVLRTDGSRKIPEDGDLGIGSLLTCILWQRCLQGEGGDAETSRWRLQITQTPCFSLAPSQMLCFARPVVQGSSPKRRRIVADVTGRWNRGW